MTNTTDELTYQQVEALFWENHDMVMLESQASQTFVEHNDRYDSNKEELTCEEFYESYGYTYTPAVKPSQSVSTQLGTHSLSNTNKPMTVAYLMAQLESIQDKSTPVYLESGEPVHYTCHGMSVNETKFFIGVM
jgi:hypothetical protein